MTTIGDRIRQRMKGFGMNQIELAEKIGVKGPSLNDIISGKTKAPRPTTLMKLAEMLETNAQWLLTGEGMPDKRDVVVSDVQAVYQFEHLDDVHRDMVKAMIQTLSNMERTK